MYHDIYRDTVKESGFQNNSSFQYKIQLNQFEEHIIAISAYCRKHTDVEVEFTFDDGGVSFFTYVAPLLEKYGFCGTFFISTNYLNTPLFLTTEQLQILIERGHNIGSHSHTHPILTELVDDVIAEEWNISVNELRKYVSDKVIASVPNGDVNKNVVCKAAEAGIKVLYTSVPTTRTKTLGNMLIVGRYVVYQGMTTKDVMAIVSNKGNRRMIYVRWQILQLIKTLLGRRYNQLKSFFFGLKSLKS